MTSSFRKKQSLDFFVKLYKYQQEASVFHVFFVEKYCTLLPRCSMQAVFLTAKVSVRLSVTRMNCDKRNESSAEIFIPHER